MLSQNKGQCFEFGNHLLFIFLCYCAPWNNSMTVAPVITVVQYLRCQFSWDRSIIKCAQLKSFCFLCCIKKTGQRFEFGNHLLFIFLCYCVPWNNITDVAPVRRVVQYLRCQLLRRELRLWKMIPKMAGSYYPAEVTCRTGAQTLDPIGILKGNSYYWKNS